MIWLGLLVGFWISIQVPLGTLIGRKIKHRRLVFVRTRP